MSMVHASSGFLDRPTTRCAPNRQVFAGIAKATLGEQSVVDWDAMVGDYALIRDKIEAVFPDLAGYNERIRDPGGFQLPNSAQQRVWKAKSGKARDGVSGRIS
jgi:hypothetical protein